MKILRWFAVWLAVAIGVGLMLSRNAANYYRLTKRGVSAQAVIQEKREHQLVAYTFDANGQEYTGLGMANMVSSYDEISIGDEVMVHYLPDAPQINCIGDPRGLYLNERSLMLLAILIFPTMIVAAFAFRERFRKWNSMRQ